MRTSVAVGVLLLSFICGFAARKQVEKVYRVDERPRLILDVEPARLTLEPGDSFRIVVDAEIPSSSIFKLEFSRDDNTITIKLASPGALGTLARQMRLYTGDEIDIEIEVPPHCHIIMYGRSGKMELRGIDSEMRSRSGSGFTRLIGWMFKLSREAVRGR